MLAHAHESQRQATHSVYMPVNLLETQDLPFRVCQR